MTDPITPQELGPLLSFQIRVGNYVRARTRMYVKGSLLTQSEMDEMREACARNEVPEDFAAILVARDGWVARAAGIDAPKDRRDPQTESPSYRAQMKDAGRGRQL